MKVAGAFHLSYCTNIHPGETWAEIRHNLDAYLPAIRGRLAPDQPFGIGLRLSAAAAATLEQPEELARFREFLHAGRYYVFTINGFPYGVFHGARVKEQVYLPDWRDPARLEYTDRLARLLAALLPDDPGMRGSVSTCRARSNRRCAPPTIRARSHDSCCVTRRRWAPCASGPVGRSGWPSSRSRAACSKRSMSW